MIRLFLFGIVFIIGGVFLFLMKKDDKKNINDKENNKKDTVKKENTTGNVRKEDMFKFMEFDKIQDDMIVQNNGSKYTMAIKCKGINYELMSDIEQMAVEEGFITFLNTLKYPIQLYVQAQNIDLKGAIKMYKDNISGIKNEYEEAEKDYIKVTEAFESTQLEIDEVSRKKDKIQNVYEYANDIISYVEKMSQNKSLLQRSFYVLVSYYTSEINSTEKFSKDEILNLCFTELYTRAQGIVSALATCSVEGKVLDSNELADLLYNAYNRDDRGIMSVKEAIQSGFYRLYSTSKDALQKKQEKIEENIENVARVKAYKAIVDAIDKNEYVSNKSEILKQEEQSSRLANEIIKRENIPSNLKEEAQESVIEEYRNIKKQIVDDISKEKKEVYNIAKSELKKMNIDTDNNIDNNSNSNNENTNKIDNTDNLVKDINNETENAKFVPNYEKNNIEKKEVFNDENKKVDSDENDSII